MALCYHRASTVSYLIWITHPSDHTPEIQKYQNTDMVSLQTSILSLYLGYFYISDWLLYWLLHWHLYIWKVLFFSKAGVLRNNAAHSLQMFMLFRTNYIYFCLLFTICIVPRLLENVILLSPLIKWHYSSCSWCLAVFVSCALAQRERLPQAAETQTLFVSSLRWKKESLVHISSEIAVIKWIQYGSVFRKSEKKK